MFFPKCGTFPQQNFVGIYLCRSKQGFLVEKKDWRSLGPQLNDYPPLKNLGTKAKPA